MNLDINVKRVNDFVAKYKALDPQLNDEQSLGLLILDEWKDAPHVYVIEHGDLPEITNEMIDFLEQKLLVLFFFTDELGDYRMEICRVESSKLVSKSSFDFHILFRSIESEDSKKERINTFNAMSDQQKLSMYHMYINKCIPSKYDDLITGWWMARY